MSLAFVRRSSSHVRKTGAVSPAVAHDELQDQNERLPSPTTVAGFGVGSVTPEDSCGMKDQERKVPATKGKVCDAKKAPKAT